MDSPLRSEQIDEGRRIVRRLVEALPLVAFEDPRLLVRTFSDAIGNLTVDQQRLVVVATAGLLGFNAQALTTGDIRTQFPLPDGRFVSDIFSWPPSLSVAGTSSLHSVGGVAGILAGVAFLDNATADLQSAVADRNRHLEILKIAREVSSLSRSQLEDVHRRWRRTIATQA